MRYRSRSRMEEFEFPCPKCNESLISDEETAGSEALCPYCDGLIVMPSAPPNKVRPKSLLPARAGELAPELTERRSRSKDARQIPDGRSKISEIEKLAAVANCTPVGDLSKIDTKGQVSFGCPACGRLVWIRQKDAGKVVTCGGCSQDVICPSTGNPARLVNPGAATIPAMPKAVLPTKRSADHLPLEEFPIESSNDEKAPTRRRTQLPSGPNRVTHEPESKLLLKSVKPIPQSRDVEISPTVLKRYRAGSQSRRKGQGKNEDTRDEAPEEEKPGHSQIPATRLPPSKGGGGKSTSPSNIDSRAAAHRLSPQLRPKLATRGDLEDSSGGDEWGQDASDSPRGMRRLVIGAIAMGIPALAAAVFFAFQGSSSDSEETGTEVAQEAAANLLELEDTKEVLQGFIEADTIAERLKWVRDSERVHPLMIAHYERQDNGDYLPAIEQVTWSVSGMVDDRKFTKLSVRFKDDELRAAVFEIGENGPKLDWESFVFFADPPISEFVSTQPSEPAVYRVTCSKGDYYNPPYDDEAKYLCFDVVAPNGIAQCFAYTTIDSEVVMELGELLKRERDRRIRTGTTGEKLSVKVTLKLHFDKDESGISDSQAWIDEVVSDSWLVP